MGITAFWASTYVLIAKGFNIYVVTKHSLVEFTKMWQKKKAWSFQNGGKQPALNDTCSQSNKLENFLTQQKILRSINDNLWSMDCWETAFSNYNRVWIWTQIHYTAWFSAILCWSKTRECKKHPTTFYIWASFLECQHKLSLMEIFVFIGKFTDCGFKFFSLFLLSKILRMYLRRFGFI